VARSNGKADLQTNRGASLQLNVLYQHNMCESHHTVSGVIETQGHQQALWETFVVALKLKI